MSIASGNVKAWDEASGSGLITGPDGSDIFVQRSALTDGPSLAVGGLVTFEQAWDPALNRMVAKMCVGATQPGMPGAGMNGYQGPQQQPQAAAAPGAPGKTGAAWANMPDPSDNLYICGLPLTCSEEQLRGIFSSYGAVVSVKVLPDNGKPDRAALVRMAELQQAQWLVENVNQNIPIGLNSPIVVRFAQKSSNKISTGETMTGVVKVWMDERGMGFIKPTAGGDDYFVHRSDLCDGQSLIQGSTVSFDPGWDVQKNKPVAKKVSGAVPNLSGAPAPPPGGMPTPPVAAGVAAGAMTAGMRDGYVKVWFEEKGFGFITPSDGSADTFVHRSSLQGANALVQGTAVKYTSEMDHSRGRSIAKLCVPAGTTPGLPAAPVAAAPAPGTTKAGSVKVWFEEKGYGFITTDDGSGDIFVHRSSLTDGSLLVAGTRVTYEVQWNQVKGKMVAAKVTGATPQAGSDGMQAIAAAPAAAPVPPPAAVPVPGEEVILSSLPATCTEESLRATFAPYGAVVDCRMLPDNAQGKVASLRMGTAAQAAWMVQNLNGNMPVGFETPIQVTYAAAGYGRAPAEAGFARAAPY